MIQTEPIISSNCRVRYPDDFRIGAGSIVDDFCYFSTRIKVGKYCHVASGCAIAGGPVYSFSLGDYSSLSAGVKVWTTSNDFVCDLITIIPEEVGDIRENIAGDVRLERCTGVGSNSVIMPNNHIPEGSVIGALSFVPAAYPFEPWTVYAGTPIRPIRSRDRQSVLMQLEQYERVLEQAVVPASELR